LQIEAGELPLLHASIAKDSVQGRVLLLLGVLNLRQISDNQNLDLAFVTYYREPEKWYFEVGKIL
jgi:hypothetical protein